MTDKTGGTAFPQHALEANPNGGEPRIVWQEGMTLRDYFAAKAMLWVAEDMPAQANFFERVADQSYKLADAMLKAREQ
jgi:hypothetical protein